ncbi:MAG: hypothetical protein GX314_06150 [Clostridiaceae bacterium]|nr:hypothetical protein [Clostridiaceae bacterium]
MARYCFYCGKELSAEEKCRCREQAYNNYTTADSEQSDSRSESRSSGPNQQSSYQSSQSQQNSSSDSSRQSGRYSSSSGQSSTGGYSQQDPYSYSRQNSSRRFGFGSLFSRLHRRRAWPTGTSATSVPGAIFGIAGWITAPADKIRTEALNPKRNRIAPVPLALNLIFLMLWFAFFYYRIAHSLSLFHAGIASPEISRLLLYSLLISLFLCLMEVFLIWLLLKLLAKLPVTYLDVLRRSRSAYIYLLLFVLLALGSVSAIPMTSLAVVISGFFFAIYVHIRTLVYTYKLSGNMQLRLMVFTMILFSALFALVERLIPVLIRVTVAAPANPIV